MRTLKMVWQDNLKPSIEFICNAIDQLHNKAYQDKTTNEIKELCFKELNKLEIKLKKKGYVWNYDTQTAMKLNKEVV